MKEGSRANALLMELLLVIFFFMISAAILVQVFADAARFEEAEKMVCVQVHQHDEDGDDHDEGDHRQPGGIKDGQLRGQGKAPEPVLQGV